MKLSVIIPTYKDPDLERTIGSLLSNAEYKDNLEIIPVFDGYLPKNSFKEDSRIKPVYVSEKKGMRNAINTGVLASSGDFIMKTDAHCKFGKSYDRLILENIEENWVVVPRMYKLDTDKWEVMEGRGSDYSRLIFHESKQRLSGLEMIRRTKERAHILIDETMMFQGSCWIMSRKWWDKAIKKMEDDKYGSLSQEATEIALKTFIAGGKVMVNKKTWYAHKHRNFGRTHKINDTELKQGSDYILNNWKKEIDELNKHFGL